MWVQGRDITPKEDPTITNLCILYINQYPLLVLVVFL